MQAQKKDFSVNVETKAHYGFIVPHRTGVQNLIAGHIKAFEINYDIPTFGKQEWEQSYNYPTWGFSFYYADLANRQQLGTAAGVFPYINFPVVKKKTFRLNYHFGWGLAYLSKKFDRVDNYKNILIGTKLNAILSFGIESEFKLSERFSSAAGISFTHFSNGAFRVPNLGINIPSVNAGVSYYIGKTNREFLRDSVVKFRKKQEIAIVTAGGLKTVYPYGNSKNYPAFTLSANFISHLSKQHQFSIGFDLFYNSALLNYFERAKIPLKNNSEIIQSALFFCYGANISRITILLGSGVYIYTKYKFDGPLYQRIGLRYKISEKLFANVTLKSHFFKADFAEWGIGVKI